MMRIMLKLSLALWATQALADYSQHPKAIQLADELAATGQYSRAEVLQLLSQAQRNPKLIETERTAPERTRTWPEYRSIFMDAKRIANGVRFMREHYPALARASGEYGVPAHVITAIIGVETLYGGYTGPHPVIDSLATQGFDHPTRTPFFYNELKEYFLLCRDMGFDPLAQKGSYAGAMGLSQFMPSNYRRLGLDYDGDGQVNLWSSSDAIGSVANYLKNFRGSNTGWRAGEAVAFPVKVTSLPDKLPLNQKSPSHTWAAIRPHVEDLEVTLEATQPVGLLALDTGDGQEYWLALPNFYSILSYNPRTYYAMAVFQVSQAIAAASLAE